MDDKKFDKYLFPWFHSRASLSLLHSLNINVYLTRTKVIHKQVSQGCNKVRGSESEKITKSQHNMKVAFWVMINLIKNLLLYKVSIHINFHK